MSLIHFLNCRSQISLPSRRRKSDELRRGWRAVSDDSDTGLTWILIMEEAVQVLSFEAEKGDAFEDQCSGRVVHEWFVEEIDLLSLTSTASAPAVLFTNMYIYRGLVDFFFLC